MVIEVLGSLDPVVICFSGCSLLWIYATVNFRDHRSATPDKTRGRGGERAVTETLIASPQHQHVALVRAHFDLGSACMPVEASSSLMVIRSLVHRHIPCFTVHLKNLSRPIQDSTSVA